MFHRSRPDRRTQGETLARHCRQPRTAPSSSSRGSCSETKERLQSTIEELETANEELRSSNEELLSVNEELQSTNEELETSKEELQSVNEELQTVNNELRNKIDELDRVNSDLHNLFQSTQIATIFLDRNLVIRSFTPAVDQAVQPHPGRPRPPADRYRRPDRLPGSGTGHPSGIRRGGHRATVSLAGRARAITSPASCPIATATSHRRRPR